MGARSNVIARVRTGSEVTSVEYYGRTITFPSCLIAAIQLALSRSEFAVRDLPGELDDVGKLTLIRRLVREGLVVVTGVA